MSHVVPRGPLLLLMAAATAGCPRSHDPADRDEPPASEPADPCVAAAETLETALSTCCEWSAAEAHAVDALIELDRWCHPPGKRLVSFDQMRACLDQRREAWSRCEEPLYYEPGHPCADLFAPAAEEGDECFLDECVEGLLCMGPLFRSHCEPAPEPGDACVVQTCGPTMICVEGQCRDLLHEGEVCQDPETLAVTPCAADLYCSPTDARCVPLPEDGELCLGIWPACAGDLVCIDGACTPPRAEGEACTNHASCASGYCDTAVGRCVTMEPPPPMGLCYTRCIDCEDVPVQGADD